MNNATKLTVPQPSFTQQVLRSICSNATIYSEVGCRWCAAAAGLPNLTSTSRPATLLLL